jgi:hypothetical protein
MTGRRGGQGQERGGSDAWRIVTDERRRHGRLSAPPLRGRPEKGTGYVGALVRATSPPYTLLLAGALLRAILAIAGIEYGP